MTDPTKLSEEDARRARYSLDTQDAAYRGGAYDYLESVDLSPRMAIMAAYIKRFGARRVLDIGCGFCDLLNYMDGDVGYIGVDISEAAVGKARKRFAGRADTAFHVVDFRDWTASGDAVDAVVWAGIARTWTRAGAKGDFADWLEIVELAERSLAPGGIVIFEMVTPHWPELERLIEGRYDTLAGCDLDCLADREESLRSIRVFRRE
ncbi:MAG: methyltransferase domain-containing protein [Proteobacteria bacterium]|nr:methyltransferase domain-containing protein [Pseudomonadota bacterium]